MYNVQTCVFVQLCGRQYLYPDSALFASVPPNDYNCTCICVYGRGTPYVDLASKEPF